jgi:CTP synthase
MEEQKNIKNKGGTMRLGSFPCSLEKGTLAYRIYQKGLIYERHRHRYEFNNRYKALFQKKGMYSVGICKERNLVEIIEIPDHPWFIGVQFHPEFKSKPMDPHPLFVSFVQAGLNFKKQFKRIKSVKMGTRSKEKHIKATLA